MSNIINGYADEDGGATLYGRVTARDGTGTSVTGEGKCLKQADLSTITFAVYDLSDSTHTAVATGSLPITDVIFDTLKTVSDDPAWRGDSTGFNFRYDAPATWFPNGNRQYQVEVKFTTTGGVAAWGKWRPRVEDTLTS